MSDLHGKRVLVTGATGGVGPAIVEALLAMGAGVVASARRRTGLDSLRAELRHHDRLDVAECDAADSDGLESLFDAVERDEPLDAVVHSVGAFRYGLLAELPAGAIDEMVRANFLSTMHVLRSAVRRMVPRGRGSIVVMSAEQALSPGAGFGVYGATKAAATHLVQTAALEVHGTGVRANAILPGVVDTTQNRTDMPDADRSGWASPRAVARAAVWLCSDDAEGANGSLVRIPGT